MLFLSFANMLWGVFLEIDSRVKTSRHGVFIEFSETQETNIVFLKDFHLARIVPSVLDLTNMGALQHELTHATLSDTSTDGLWEFTIQKHLMPGEILSFRASAEVKLLDQDFRTDTDSHGGELERTVKQGVPDEQVPIDSSSAIGPESGPVVVVGGSAVMTKIAIFLISTDSNQEDSTVFLAKNILALLGGGIGVLLEHLVGSGKVDILGKDGRHAVLLADNYVCFVHSLVDIFDCVLQVVHIAVLGRNDLLPIPLVDIAIGDKK
jgi:hypothetical protein